MRRLTLEEAEKNEYTVSYIDNGKQAREELDYLGVYCPLYDDALELLRSLARDDMVIVDDNGIIDEDYIVVDDDKLRKLAHKQEYKKDAQILKHCISSDDIVLYDEGYELGDLFVELEVINPENSQSIVVAWVPLDMACQLEAERETAETTQYHDWSADYYPIIEKKCDVDDIEECKVEVTKAAKERLHNAMWDYPCISGGDISVDVSDADCGDNVFVTAKIDYFIEG